MRSQLEMEVSYRLGRLSFLLAQRDRLVVIGAGLSFIPVFPACLLGLLVSLANLYIGTHGRLQRADIRIAKAGVAAGATLTVIWMGVLILFNPLAAALEILELLLEVLNVFFHSISINSSNGELVLT